MAVLAPLTEGVASAHTGDADLTPDFVDSAAQAIDEFGHLPSQVATYGGVVETGNASHINVYLTTLSSPAEQAYLDINSAVDPVVSFIQTPRSWATEAAFHEQVTSDVDQLSDEGLQFASWWPEIRTGREDIQLVDPSPDQTQLLDDQFGSERIDVEAISPDQTPGATSSRIDDSTPRNGGTSTTDNTNGGCTSGFPVTWDSVAAMLSASHCYNGDAATHDVHNDIIVGGVESGSDAHIGDFEDRETGSGAGDTSVYKISNNDAVSAQIWTGEIGSPTLTTVKGTDNTVDGSPICKDGSYSGEVCEINVEDGDVCSTYSDFRRVCHLMFADTSDQCSDACIANQAGDSGGPVVRTVSGGVDAAGIVSGHSGLPLDCEHNATTCYATLYFVPISWALNDAGLGVTLKTG